MSERCKRLGIRAAHNTIPGPRKSVGSDTFEPDPDSEEWPLATEEQIEQIKWEEEKNGHEAGVQARLALGVRLPDDDDAEEVGAVKGQTRLTEILIGRLLGEPVVGTNQHSAEGLKLSGPLASLDDRYRADFRYLAANAGEATRLIEAQGIVERSRLLRVLREGDSRPTGSKPRPAPAP